MFENIVQALLGNAVDSDLYVGGQGALALDGEGDFMGKEQLRAVPGKGLGYGLLRYVVGDRRLAARPEPQIGFNYLGQLDAALLREGAGRDPAEITPV